MTEEWWQKYKKNKDRNKNFLFDEVESEIKRKFKAEKSPDEMYSMCKTDNNYWKHFRSSENLDDETIGLVLCKTVGCDLMYCQALTFSKGANLKGIETFGCKEQFDSLRQCYITERRRFNSLFSEEQWRSDKGIIPEYLKKELEKQKQESKMEKLRYNNMTMPQVTPPKEHINDKGMTVTNSKDGYF